MTAALATQIPPGRTIFIDSNGTPLVNGTLYTYVPSTSTLKTTYQDSALGVSNPNPIVLGSDGGCLLWGIGNYRFLLKDSNGNTISDTISEALTVGNTFLNIQTVFGALGDGVTDDTIAIQAGLNYLNTTGGCLYFPTGKYRITSALSVTFTYSTVNSITRPSIKGDGPGNSQILWDGANTPETFMMTIQRTDSSDGQGLHAHSVIEGIGFLPIASGKNQYASGLNLSKWAYIHVRDVWFHRLQHGLWLDQVLSSAFDTINARFCNNGIQCIGAPSSSLSAVYNDNALTFIGCIIGANLIGGLGCTDANLIFLGGTIEANGQSGTSGSGFGAKFANTSTSGSVVCKFDGTYFEANGTAGDLGVNASTADIWIIHSDAVNNLTYSINDCIFNRVGSTYAPIGIYINRTVESTAYVLNMLGNNFMNYGGYTPSANRKYVSLVNDAGVGKAITGITKANPAVVTAVAHGFSNGDIVAIASVAGMTQVNGLNFIVAGKTTDTFQLSGVDSSGYGVYTSGGTATLLSVHTTINDAGNYYNQPSEQPNYLFNVGVQYYQGLGQRAGALVYPSVQQSIANNTSTAITFSTAAYNFYSIWEGVTNPTRLTVPANVGWVRITGNIDFAATTADSSVFVVVLNKNGSATWNGKPKVSLQSGATSTVYEMNFTSPILAVSAGDYFEMVVSQGTGGSLNTGSAFNSQWFSMEIIN